MRQFLFAPLIGLLAILNACSDAPRNEAGLNLSSLAAAIAAPSALPPLEPFVARDGTRLHYRHYPGDSDTVLILLHGSATHSAYLYPLAQALSESGAASVYTPDLRGHGPSPARRGDIDYIGQLEDDLADLITHVKATSSEVRKLVVGGHSSGGGLAVRFAGGAYRELASAYVLLAPYLGHDAPTVRRNSGGWADPSLVKIVPISILNGFGITSFNATPVLGFNLPEEYRSGTETLSYSYRLMMGFSPSDFAKDLGAVKVPLLLLAGTDDETFFSSEFEPTIRPLVPHAAVELLKDASHLEVVSSTETSRAVRRWLQEL